MECLNVRVDVVQQRLAEHRQVARLHRVVGHVQDEEVDGRLRWPQLVNQTRQGQ